MSFLANFRLLRLWVVGAIVLLLVACEPVQVSPTGGLPVATILPVSTISPSAAAIDTASVTPVSQVTGSSLNLQATQVRGQIVRFWQPWTGSTGEALEALVEEYNLNNPWHTVISLVSLAGFDELNARLSATKEQADRPDVVLGYWHQVLEWDEQAPLVDWQPYLTDPQWGWSTAEQADFYPEFWNYEVTAGRRLGLPAQRFGAVLFYNHTWAQELGFATPPNTPEEFRVQACAAARSFRLDDRLENDGMGGWIIRTDYPVLLGWLYSFGAELVSPSAGSEESIYRFNSPQVAEAFTFLKNLYDAGCAWLPETQSMEEAFASRRGLFAAGSIADVPALAQEFQDQGNLDEWQVIPFPSLGKPAMDIYGPAYVMLPSYPERQLAAWLFVKWLLEPGNQALLIEASGAFPLRRSALSRLAGFQSTYPQWQAAVDLLPFAHTEPSDRSWGVVRWALSDAGTQLFRSYFRLDQLPGLLEYLDFTAAELYQTAHAGPESAVITDEPLLTGTPTP